MISLAKSWRVARWLEADSLWYQSGPTFKAIEEAVEYRQWHEAEHPGERYRVELVKDVDTVWRA